MNLWCVKIKRMKYRMMHGSIRNYRKLSASARSTDVICKVPNYGHLKDFVLLFIIKFGPIKTMLSKVIFNTSIIR